MKYIMWLLGCLLSCGVYAGTTFSCVPAVVKVENKNIILPGPVDEKSVRVYFFNNISKQNIWLDHPVEKPSASAGWASYLHSGHWSALVVNQKDFKISCGEIMPDKVTYYDCAKIVAICTPASMEIKEKSSVWWIEDKSWDEVVRTFSH